MRTITWKQRLRYRFDRLMARGTVAHIFALFVATLFLVLLVSIVVFFARINIPGAEDVPFIEILWIGLMRSLDPGTMGNDQGWTFRISMLVITIGGLLFLSALIGVLTTGIESFLDELRKGRSVVAEKGHSVILGWSPQVFSIISELVIANQNLNRSAIAILAVKDKLEMEDEIKAKVGRTNNTSVICRTGSPIDLTDIEIVNPHLARSIIILSPPGIDPDARVIKTILALTNNPNRKEGNYHIVAEIRDPKNLHVAKMVGGDEVQLVLTDDLISRIATQTCHLAGLSTVYTDLLDFAGDEIYFHHEPKLAGMTFGDALLAYEDSTLIGLRRADGQILLNPPMDTIFSKDDQVIAISEDDDTVCLSGKHEYEINEDAIKQGTHHVHEPERILILGWNRRTLQIITELDHYAAPGSQLTVVSSIAVSQSALQSQFTTLQNLDVSFNHQDTTERQTLEGLPLGEFKHVVIQSYADEDEPQDADAKTMVTLLHLRDIADNQGYGYSIVSEILDIQNRDLVRVARVDDFIVSEKLVSLMLTQVSENRALKAVFDELFDPEGSELYLKSAADYVLRDRPVNFYTIVEAARQRSQVAIGYKLKEPNRVLTDLDGVRLNPPKSEMVSYTVGDQIIVLSED